MISVPCPDNIDRRKLVERRKALGLRPVDVANRLEISRARYGNYEKGYRPFSVPIAAKLAAILGISLEELITESAAPRKNLRNLSPVG